MKNGIIDKTKYNQSPNIFLIIAVIKEKARGLSVVWI